MTNNSRKACYYSFLALLLLTILPTAANAGIFDPTITDKSLEYLSSIFGEQVGSIAALNQEIPSNNSLSNLFKIFNCFALTIAVFILSYVSIISTVNTAREGEVMGKKWSSIWIPMRSAVGLLLLAPIPNSGYSCLQILVMWIFINGVGAANKVWDFVLDNLSSGISATQAHEINKEDFTTVHHQTTNLAKGLFNSLTCMHLINKHHQPKNPALINYYWSSQYPEILNDESGTSISNTLKFGVQGADNPNQQNLCGEFEIISSFSNNEITDYNNNPIELSSTENEAIVRYIFYTKKLAIETMISNITQVASAIINDARTTDDNSNAILPSVINQPTGFLYKIVKDYQKTIHPKLSKQAIMHYLGRSIKVEPKPVTTEVIKQGKDLGWLTAGSYYYLLSQGNTNNLLNTATDSIKLTNQLFAEETLLRKNDLIGLEIYDTQLMPYIRALHNRSLAINNWFASPSDLTITDNMQQAINSNSINYTDLLSEKELIKKTNAIKLQIPEYLTKLLNNVSNSIAAPHIESFFSLNQTILQDIQNRLSKNHDDPLLSQAMFGMKLMQYSENCWVEIIMSSFLSSKIDIFTQTDNISSLNLLIAVLPVILIFAGIFWLLGATLAIYTPMVPYMMFTITALSWFLLVVEAVVAAPIVALGFIAPSQDELGKVAPALGIITNGFLKPSLMVIGLILAAKIYSVVVGMINMGFRFSFAALQSKTGTSMFSWIVMLILYSGFIVTLVNKCYGLIYGLPDKVLRWIGITGEQTDISSIKETQQQFDQHSKQSIGVVEGQATAAAEKFKENVQAATKKDGSALHPHGSV